MELYNNVVNNRKKKQSPATEERMRRMTNSNIESLTGQDAEEYRKKKEAERGSMPQFPGEDGAQDAPASDRGGLDSLMDKVKKAFGVGEPSWEEKVGQAFKRADKRTKK